MARYIGVEATAAATPAITSDCDMTRGGEAKESQCVTTVWRQKPSCAYSFCRREVCGDGVAILGLQRKLGESLRNGDDILYVQKQEA